MNILSTLLYNRPENLENAGRGAGGRDGLKKALTNFIAFSFESIKFSKLCLDLFFTSFMF